MLLDIDRYVIETVTSIFGSEISIWTASILSLVGNFAIIWIIISLVISIREKDKMVFILTVTALLLSLLVADIVLKGIFTRTRPFESFEGVKTFLRYPVTYSFPSGHAASSFAAAVVISKYKGATGWVFFTLASLIALSRLVLLFHYITDIAAGAMIGISIGYCVLYLHMRFRR